MRSNSFSGLLLLLFSGFAFAGEGVSYVKDESFPEIVDIHREAEAWATCAATYRILSELIQESRPAKSREISNIANGAQMAVGMSLIKDWMGSSGLENDKNLVSEFEAILSYAKLAIKSLPETQSDRILADAERLAVEGEGGGAKFAANISATVAICQKNDAAQQVYIDLWRDLLKSGMLAAPKD